MRPQDIPFGRRPEVGVIAARRRLRERQLVGAARDAEEQFDNGIHGGRSDRGIDRLFQRKHDKNGRGSKNATSLRLPPILATRPA